MHPLPNFHKTLRFCQVQCFDIWREREECEGKETERRQKEQRWGREEGAQTGSKIL